MSAEAFLQAIVDDPANAATTWLVLADWLEERDDPRGELVRLCHDPNFRPELAPAERDEQVQRLLASGVQPCVPTFSNSIGMKFVLISAGTFLMGSPKNEMHRQDNEGPQHKVEITRPFYLGMYQVTQEEYQRVMGNNPSWCCASSLGAEKVRGLDTRRHPVETVTWIDAVAFCRNPPSPPRTRENRWPSWKDAVAFCRNLLMQPEEKKKRRAYRLPTEAEWEYACRGGATSSTPFHFGATLSSTQANFNGDSPYQAAKGPCLERTTPVGSYKPNAFGLFDMHGNVWEWCNDWYDEYYYYLSPRQDPQGPQHGTFRVLRGGSWGVEGHLCRLAYRRWYPPVGRTSVDIGFRVVCVAPRTP
jgi:uncharacterized protein (TIGR02996 family)